MSNLTHSIIGLPGSGKTTFLAALWHLIDAGEVNTALTLDQLVGDHQYLNDIVEAWRRCERVPRTSAGSGISVAIHATDVSTDQKLTLNFSDLSGESFESQFANRSCLKSYVNAYEEEGGMLLFITADHSEDGMTILDVNAVLPEESDANEQAGDVKEWSPEMVPTQVRLVDLLQFIQQKPFARRKRKLAVVISAWDVVPQPQSSPLEWLKRELPLLYQFLISNPESFDFKTYGISAQGGDVTGSRRQQMLQLMPSKRIICVEGTTSNSDLTAPLVWLTKVD